MACCYVFTDRWDRSNNKETVEINLGDTFYDCVQVESFVVFFIELPYATSGRVSTGNLVRFLVTAFLERIKLDDATAWLCSVPGTDKQGRHQSVRNETQLRGKTAFLAHSMLAFKINQAPVILSDGRGSGYTKLISFRSVNRRFVQATIVPTSPEILF